MIDARTSIERFGQFQRCAGHNLPLLRWSEYWRYSDGSNIVIGLVDSAFDSQVPDLAGASVETAKFAGPHDRRSPACEHATHGVATLVGQGHDQIQGVVPKAHLLVADVFGRREVADPNAVARALHWLIDSGAQIVALPLGDSRDHREIARQLQRGHCSGAIFFAAAGNSYPKPIAFPARHPAALAVGAATTHGRLLPQCNRQPRLDLVAPGCKLAAPIRGRLIRRRTGSSVACVLATGAAALALSSVATTASAVSAAKILAALRGGGRSILPCDSQGQIAR